MPKTSIDYSKTIIYKIVCKDLNVKDSYVGSTTDFIRRKQQHKNMSINYFNDSKSWHRKLYVAIHDNEGWENWEMIEIEKYSCNDKNEACARERYWYELLNANLNSQTPLRTEKEKDTSQRVKCECGLNILCTKLKKHLKQQRHFNALNQTLFN